MANETPVENNPAPSDAAIVEADPFALDETKFVSLSPEQRASLDPVLNEWKEKAKSRISETEKTWKEKYTPVEEKATALDKLVQDPRFIGWWNNLQQGVQQSVPGSQPQNIQPKSIASPEEWQMAVYEAQQGNGTRMEAIQQRFLQAAAAPVVQQLQQGQAELRATLEMKDLFEKHGDASELDAIGRNPSDPKDQSQSLLEIGLTWADNNGKSMEDGYRYAKRLADAMQSKATQAAMGMVQEKKASVTSGPSTQQGGQGVVEVADADELMSKNMEYVLAGQKPPRFVIRPNAGPSGNRWAQKS